MAGQPDQLERTVGNEPGITCVRLIATGGYGSVYEVFPVMDSLILRCIMKNITLSSLGKS